MAQLIAQAIFHALVAALVVEALLRRWRVEDPRQKVRFRLLSLAFPLLVLPLFELLAPQRHQEWFLDERALFAGVSWAQVELFGLPLFHLWLAAFASLGVLLFLRDAVPFLREQLFERALPFGQAPIDPALPAAVDSLCHSLGVRPPEIVLLDAEPPFLMCAGAVRGRLIVSRGALAALDERELAAALAHELGHLKERDPFLSWALLAARTLQAFNPVLHVMVRAIARDAERRADEVAAGATGDRLGVASGLLKLYCATHSFQRSPDFAGEPFLARARAMAIEERCRRLIDRPEPRPVPFEALRLVLTGLSLAVLLFFVV